MSRTVGDRKNGLRTGCGLSEPAKPDCRSGTERKTHEPADWWRTVGIQPGSAEIGRKLPEIAGNCRKLPKISENFSEILRGFAPKMPSFPGRHVCWGFRLPPRPATINVKVWHGGLVADCRSDPPREWRTGCGLAVKISADCRTKNKVTSLIDWIHDKMFT